MTNEEMLKQDLEKAVKLLLQSGSNTKQQVKLLLEDCLETYFKPKKYLTYDDLMKLETKSYKVLLNGSEYVMELTQHSCCGELCRVFTLIEKDKALTIIATLLSEYDKQFFNDLHLELVEE
jgi:hypothetical protein